ncbi:hypothetical protein RND71_040534 [Anisodus tanguticus]|uniref:Uncharacterized protein n=1 Tax=Anisodus tanguticus TaxID=243964 RepID=A0AAE1QVT1_9SOLA|nr:hypothetical protein RND71_040534 [Anisodus tanguticus]
MATDNTKRFEVLETNQNQFSSQLQETNKKLELIISQLETVKRSDVANTPPLISCTKRCHPTRMLGEHSPLLLVDLLDVKKKRMTMKCLLNILILSLCECKKLLDGKT